MQVASCTTFSLILGSFCTFCRRSFYSYIRNLSSSAPCPGKSFPFMRIFVYIFTYMRILFHFLFLFPTHSLYKNFPNYPISRNPCSQYAKKPPRIFRSGFSYITPFSLDEQFRQTLHRSGGPVPEQLPSKSFRPPMLS